MERYYRYLSDNTLYLADEKTGWVAIQTPFNGPFNDGITIYARKEGDNVTLCDGGETLANLALLGGRSEEVAEAILIEHEIELQGNELRAEATLESFAERKHSLLCAIVELQGWVGQSSLFCKKTPAAKPKQKTTHGQPLAISNNI